MYNLRMITSYQLTNYILSNLFNFDISPVSKLVLLYLSKCYNPQKKFVFPKQTTIAKCIGVSRYSVVRAIEELKKSNIIKSKRGSHNYYEFMLDNLTLKDKKLNNECHKLQPPHITDKEHIKEQGFNKKTFDKKVSVPIMNNPSVDETKELLQEYKDMQLTSDYTTWNRDAAVNHLRKGIPRAFLKRSVVAKYLIKKFNILPEEYLDLTL